MIYPRLPIFFLQLLKGDVMPGIEFHMEDRPIIEVV